VTPGLRASQRDEWWSSWVCPLSCVTRLATERVRSRCRRRCRPPSAPAVPRFRLPLPRPLGRSHSKLAQASRPPWSCP
jgi:hypothetical protein